MSWESKYPNYPDLRSEEAKEWLLDLYARTRAGADYSKEEFEYMQASFLTAFVEQVAQQKAVDAYLLSWLCGRFAHVLAGVPWDEAISLPGRELPEDWNHLSPTERKSMAAFCDIANSISGKVKAGQRVSTTEEIARVATARSISYESARAAFYEWKKRANWERPKKVSKKVHENLEGKNVVPIRRKKTT